MADLIPTAKRYRVKAGERYGRLTAIKFARRERRPNRRGTRTYWEFLCDCGAVHIADTANVRGSHTRSCGCFQQERRIESNTRHGMKHTTEYQTWRAMHQRCSNQNDVRYSCYGGRGIKVCERWRKFENFYADMGPRPSRKLSLERDNNDGDYEPSNCRWATPKHQARNRRSNRIVTVKGKAMTLAEAVERAGASYGTVAARLNRGWDIDRALEPF